MSITENPRPPFPPFDADTAARKVRMAEDAWNSRDPERVSLAYTPDSVWRNRAEFLSGREAIVQFLTRKWNKELAPLSITRSKLRHNPDFNRRDRAPSVSPPPEP